MNFLKNIFTNNSEPKELPTSFVNWIPFTSLNQLEEIKEVSKNETVLIFKHSTRCGISRMVIKQFEKLFDESLKDLKVYYLDLLNYRELSNQVGYTFQVLHQSPQLLIVKNGVVVEHASHYDIATVNLKVHF